MEKNKKRIFTVLAIDGGGVRGIVPARILQEIEERTGKPIAELFDMVGGTSTGAIIASGLVSPDEEDPTKPRFAAKDILNFYYNTTPKIFPEIRFKSLRKLSSGALYDPRPLEESMLKFFGDLRMKDTLTSFIIPATDIKNFRPVWITHLKGQKDTSEEGWSSMLLRDAIRATTTAPTFFPAKYIETTPNPDMPNVKHRHALIDGSFFGGNTMRHLLTQAKKLAPPDAEIIVVHVGTGAIENSLSPEEYNALGPMGLINKENGSVLISLVVDIGIMDVENDMKAEIGDRYFGFDGRIDPDEDPESPTVSIDDAREENLKRLEKFAEKLIGKHSKDMDRLCAVLKRREYAEEQHLESLQALQKLADKLSDAKTVKGLMRAYLKIVHAETNIERPGKDDAEIRALAAKLNEHHKAEIDRIYRALLDKKQHQSKLINSIKEAGEDLSRITKEIFVEPFKDGSQPPQNDNTKPPAAAAKDAFKKKPPAPGM